MNKLLAILAIWALSLAATGYLSWQAAKGKCAIAETKTISKAVEIDNKKSAEITEHATTVKKEESENVREIIKVKYIKAPADKCPMSNHAEFMRNLYEASAKTEIHKP